MNPRPLPVLLSLLLATAASAASAETVYKYRRASGQIVYSNQVIRDAELVKVFEFQFPAPPRADLSPAAPVAAAAHVSDARIKQQVAALDRAWAEVQVATRLLTLAESRLEGGDPARVANRDAPGTPARADVGAARARLDAAMRAYSERY